MKNKFKNQMLTLVFAALAVVLPAKAADGMEALRVKNNALKLQLIHAPVRAKFAATIRDLEKHKRRPWIVGTYRNPKTQAALKAKGYSKVPWSFHNAQTRQGKPDALAMDVEELNGVLRYRSTPDFYLMMAGAAQSHRLASGCGLGWSLPLTDRARIQTLIARRDWKGKWNRKGNFDPGHVQITGVSLGQAHNGVRP
ncbi:MAG TPA: hypothetical protein VGB77_21575 [Abditibacteriaceae bacterium]|jgi:hypothetical protein